MSKKDLFKIKYIYQDDAPCCACGCGGKVSWSFEKGEWNKYIFTHHIRIRPTFLEKKHSNETKEKISQFVKNNYKNFKRNKMSKEKIARLSGIIPLCGCGCGNEVKWNKSKNTWNKYINGHYSKKNPYFKNKKHSEETKNKISKSGLGKKRSEATKLKISEALKKHEYAEERINKLIEMGRINAANNIGCKNPNWKGGISCEPYCEVWLDKDYKYSIKERDGLKCQNPSCWGTSKKICLHHINYDKKDCRPENLITLCISCNSRANGFREFWELLYENIIKFGL